MPGRRSSAWELAVCTAAYNVAHHLGALPRMDAGGGTRWNDWLDVLVPYAVVGTALVALAAARTDRRGWVAALVGAAAYVQGHGIHLAANSATVALAVVLAVR